MIHSATAHYSAAIQFVSPRVSESSALSGSPCMDRAHYCLQVTVSEGFEIIETIEVCESLKCVKRNHVEDLFKE